MFNIDISNFYCLLSSYVIVAFFTTNWVDKFFSHLSMRLENKDTVFNQKLRLYFPLSHYLRKMSKSLSTQPVFRNTKKIF